MSNLLKLLLKFLLNSPNLPGYIARTFIKYTIRFFVVLISLALVSGTHIVIILAVLALLIAFFMWRDDFFVKRKIKNSAKLPLGEIKRLYKFKQLEIVKYPGGKTEYSNANKLKHHIHYLGLAENGLMIIGYNKKDKSVFSSQIIEFKDIIASRLLHKSKTKRYHETKRTETKRTITDELGRSRTENIVDETPETFDMEFEYIDGIGIGAISKEEDIRYGYFMEKYQNDQYYLTRLQKLLTQIDEK